MARRWAEGVVEASVDAAPAVPVVDPLPTLPVPFLAAEVAPTPSLRRATASPGRGRSFLGGPCSAAIPRHLSRLVIARRRA